MVLTDPEEKPLNVLILAAGLGTRMRSDRAKVLHRLDGKPLIEHVCKAALSLKPKKLFVIVGHQADEVKRTVCDSFGETAVEFVAQKRQLGTGDAVNAARSHFEGNGSTLLILSGDVPLIRAETLRELIAVHRLENAACTILTVRLEDPYGYGRIVRSHAGFERIVEQKDATDAQREIAEINSGINCFDTGKLFNALSRVEAHNAQGEYYLTDVPRILMDDRETVALFQHDRPIEVEGVNDRKQLAAVERMIHDETIESLMKESGVTFIDPRSAYVSAEATIGQDTVVHPNVTIEGRTVIGANCIIRSGTRLSNAVVGDNVEIRDNCLIVDSEIGDDCIVGPMAHMRGHAVMVEGSKIGNFVEMKKSRLGKNSKSAHLTYLGDATIGEDTNIGAGIITCNFDGKNKHETRIGDRVKIGSDTMLVAPVEVGDGAVTAAGSVVIHDVPEDSLVAGVPAKIKKSLKTDQASSDSKAA
jgi:bifunctional UDP-N-acetylglucosamine pyrophosphorylase/glucosamine-1-phosphate N-acetyltransferase